MGILFSASSCRNGFRYFIEPGLDGFEPNTYETFPNDLEWLALQHGAVTKGRFDLMQQALGIAYDPLSLPMSDMRGCARIPDTRFCDWMHNLCASGGVLQYHINAFCIALVNMDDVEEQMSLAHLDEFQRKGEGTEHPHQGGQGLLPESHIDKP